MANGTRNAIAAVIGTGALTIAGCATSPVGADDAKVGTLISNPWQNPSPNAGEFVVTRDKGLMGGACSQEVYVDSHAIATLRTGQKVIVYLPPGKHMAGVRPTGLCGGGSAGVALTVEAGKRQVYRVASGQSGDVKIEPSPF